MSSDFGRAKTGALNLDLEILRALFAGRGDGGYVSGAALSEKLGVTRSAVWKHMEQLQALGYLISSQPHLGYRLGDPIPDLLVADELLARMPKAGKEEISWRPIVFRETQSTNDLVLREAQVGQAEGLVIAADKQTQGRGRQGRKWVSRAGDGLYASILLRPRWPLSQVARLTIFASLAIAEAVETLTTRRIEIKWPNDLFHEGKKLGGILTEIQADAESLRFAVIGFGINCRQTASDFPDEIRNIATSLRLIQGAAPRRADLLLAILDRLAARARDPFGTVREAWAARCLSVGKLITVQTPSGLKQGQALGLDENGALLLRREGGVVEAVTAGDVS